MKRQPWYTTIELGAEVGRSPGQILDMIKAGSLVAVKLPSGTYRIPLGAALATFAPDEIRPGNHVALPPGAGAEFFVAIERQEAAVVGAGANDATSPTDPAPDIAGQEDHRP